TAHDRERWSYAWGGEGAVDFAYCPWSRYEHEEFDGWVMGLDLPWSAKRLRQIESGKADPNEVELEQWRRARCRSDAEGDDCWIAWIVPMREGNKIEAYALWLFDARAAPEDPPDLGGVFDSVDEAKAKLLADGVIRRERGG